MTNIAQHFHGIESAIRYAQKSHIVTGQNLANVNTPGYKTLEIPFNQLLSQMNGPAKSNGQAPNFTTSEKEGLATRTDGNNVDLDREIAALKKNALAYQTLTQLLGSKISLLKQAIRD